MEGTCYVCNKNVKFKKILEHMQDCCKLDDDQNFVIVSSNNYWQLLLCTNNIKLFNFKFIKYI